MKKSVKELSFLYKNMFGSLPRFPATVQITEDEMIQQLEYCLENNVRISHFYQDYYEDGNIY